MHKMLRNMCIAHSIVVALGSSTLTDLAKLAKPASGGVPSTKAESSLVQSPGIIPGMKPKSMVAVDPRWDSREVVPKPASSAGPEWKVKILVTLMIVSIATAVAVAVVKTAKVLGFVSSDDTGVRAHLSTKEEDPEALTRLLASRSMQGYGSIFSSALGGSRDSSVIIRQ